MGAYQIRVNYLKERLQAEGSIFKTSSDAAWTWLALRGIADAYPELYNRLVVVIESKEGLAWNKLIEEFQRIDTSERQQPSMTNVTIASNKAKADDTKDDKPDHNTKKQCDVCNQMISGHVKHCKGCGIHIWRKSKECWWCHPDKASDKWKHKEKAIQLKEERQRSTTGPLYQQSGVANPSTSKNPPMLEDKNNTKSILFTSNMTSLSMDPDFRRGP
jgi:hypothetical protein